MNEEQIDKIIKKLGIIIFIAIFVAWGLFNGEAVSSIINFIMKILNPFLIGIFIALFLNIPMCYFEKKLQTNEKKRKVKKRQGIALLFSILAVLLIVSLVLLLIIPELIKTAIIIANNAPLYQEFAEQLVDTIKGIYPDVDVDSVSSLIISNIENIRSTLKEQIPQILSSFLGGVMGTIYGFINFFIGITFACLILNQKQKVKEGLIRVLYAYVKKERADRVYHFFIFFHDSFNKFIVAQCLSAVILGGLCILGCLLLQVPYAVQVGILVGFLSLIPMFGVIVGIFIGLILIVVASPIKALVFLVFSIIIWQVCENFIKPRIIGKKIGISDLWLFIATIAGGTAFGVPGLILSVPVVNAIYCVEADRLNKAHIIEKEENV